MSIAKLNVPMTRPLMGDEELQAVKAVLDSGWLIMGPKVDQFENMVKEYVGVQYAKACSSCTTGLHMSLLSGGVRRYQNVLLPSYTFVATANAIEYCGAIPEFVDIDLKTFNISVQGIRESCHRKAAKDIVAVIPVHLFGLCADMKSINRMARDRDWLVVEDAACSLGSTTPQGTAGTLGNVANFSLHPRKSITTGEGGMITTNDPDMAARIHAYRDFGFTTTNIERHRSGATIMPTVEVLGYNYRMTDIQAAIGVEQMKKFPSILEAKRRIASVYDREFGGLPWIQIPFVPDGYGHSYQSYAMLVGGGDYVPKTDYIDKYGEVRNRLMAHLKERGVASRQGTHAVHMLDYYARKYKLSPMDFPNTYAADKMAITIPLFPQMTEVEIQHVIESVREFQP